MNFNPLVLWTSLTPWTKRIAIIGIFLTAITLIIAAAYTGNLDELIKYLFEDKA